MSYSLFRGLAAVVLAASLVPAPLRAQQGPPPAGAPQPDDPHAADDFAFATREGLLPVPQRQGDTAYINFDFELQRAAGGADEHLSSRPRAEAA